MAPWMVLVPLIVVTSQTPGAGKTGVAAAIARHYAYLGRPVTIARAESAEQGGNVAEDAAYFGTLDYTPGSPAGPLAAASVADPGANGILIVEAEAATAASISGATSTVLVARNAAPASAPAGVAPSAVVVTDVPHGKTAATAGPGGVPVVVLGEDRTLAGFSVSEAKAAINAEVLVPGDNGDPSCDHLVISPISSDAGQPYFRRFGSKAVVVRFDRTDMHLAAMKAQPECLILTGGRRPSDYLFDAATASGTPVLLSRTDTENTVIALEGLFDRTRFQGDRKLDRMAELLDASALYETLAL